MPQIESGDELYRNYDCVFERELARNDVPRRLSINLLFTDTADGFSLAATAENGVRVYCPIEGHDPWHSEFMVFNEKIVYRATGGDQERVTAPAGQKLYLNFSNDTGRIE